MIIIIIFAHLYTYMHTYIHTYTNHMLEAIIIIIISTHLPTYLQPYLLSGADDNQVRIWDYQTKACVQTLEGHTHNVAAVLFHPR